ncbi:hypothetical protein ACA910_022264 [Epithemia clementina (nom. ined.)]
MMNPNDTTPPNIDYVVTILRTQHREYQRKNPSELKKQVEIAVAFLLSPSNQPQQQQPPQPSPSSRKRRASDDNEEQYDTAAATEEAIREKIDAGGGLNASLRNRYRQQQQQQQLQQEVQREDRPQPASDVQPEVRAATPENKVKPLVGATSSSKVKKRKRVVPVPTPAARADPTDDVPFLQPVPRPKERYADLGGMDSTIRELRQLVEYPILRPELYRHLGIEPPRGVLLRGPPGTGKSHLANAVAGELGVNFFRVSAPELVSGMSGESEGRIRDLFKTASDQAPSIIFLDEIDAVAPKRSEAGSSRGMEKRMVAQLLTSMDAISPDQNRDNAAVIVLAATNRPDSLDSALRRAGRFDREILLGVPDEDAREKIIRAMTAGMRLSGNFDFRLIAKKTPGFVGADVRSLSKEAAVLAINRIFQDVLQKGEQQKSGTEGKSADSPKELTPAELEPLYVTMADFLGAIPSVQPSSKREGFATVPDVNWDDVGALQSIREELAMSVIEPIRNPEKFKAIGLTIHAGVLLYGPPGCGKTLLAKAIANESGANFISVKGPELLDKYVGESERAVRLVFERARASSPCVVFFDELDSLVPKRGMDSSGSGVSERVVNQLLTELDGLDSRRSVFVIAATNRPELIDPAMMRPGRLDKLLYVPVPTPEDRVSILTALAKSVKLGTDVDLAKIGSSDRATGFSGADCAALLREAGLAAIKEDTSNSGPAVRSGEVEPLCIRSKHFDAAFKSVMPSVSEKDQKRYDRIRERISCARSRAIEDTESSKDLTAVNTDGVVVGPHLMASAKVPQTTPDDATAEPKKSALSLSAVATEEFKEIVKAASKQNEECEKPPSVAAKSKVEQGKTVPSPTSAKKLEGGSSAAAAAIQSSKADEVPEAPAIAKGGKESKFTVANTLSERVKVSDEVKESKSKIIESEGRKQKTSVAATNHTDKASK